MLVSPGQDVVYYPVQAGCGSTWGGIADNFTKCKLPVPFYMNSSIILDLVGNSSHVSLIYFILMVVFMYRP
jgi:hypothetical protein